MVITMVENIVAEAVMAVEITALLHATIFVRIHARRSAVPRNILTIKIFSFQMCQTNKMSEAEW